MDPNEQLPLPDDLLEALRAIMRWMGYRATHLANKVYQWAEVYEAQQDDPRPEQIVALVSPR